MRVTKLIREYVEKTVKERMPNPEKPTDTLQDEYNALVVSLETYCKEAIKEFALSHGGEFYFSYSGYGADDVGAQIHYVDRSCDLHHPHLNALVVDNYNKLCKEMAKKRNAVIEDILVSLELGANRAELEEMLSKIG
jgi:hypothetical protein